MASNNPTSMESLWKSETPGIFLKQIINAD